MKQLEVGAGDHIAKACQKLAKAAPAWMEFNGIRVEALGGESPADLRAMWQRAMNDATAEHDRKRRAFEATPEGQQQLAETARARAEEERLTREAAEAVESSGIRDRFPWREGMRELSGFGGCYEQACRKMMYTALLWLEQNPSTDPRNSEDAKKAFEKAVLRAEPACSGAMFGTACSHAMFIHVNGYDAWSKKMREPS
jgi:hypothetical protein